MRKLSLLKGQKFCNLNLGTSHPHHQVPPKSAVTSFHTTAQSVVTGLSTKLR